MATAPTIAVVNHSPAFTRLLGIALEIGGYQTLVCLTTEDAHQLILDHRPDLVLIDSRIGESDGGWQVLETLRRDAATLHIPIIVTSPDPRKVAESAAKLDEMLRVRLLAKPFTPDDVLTTIGQMLAA